MASNSTPSGRSVPPELSAVVARRDAQHAAPAEEGGLTQTGYGGAPPARARLSALDFSDLYLSEADRECFIRGFSEDGKSPLVSVPGDYLGDVEDLHVMVCDKGQTRSEFMLDYDGIRYRVAKIPNISGAWYALRRAKLPIPGLMSFDFPRAAVRHLAWLGQKSGLLLVAGATGDGKTTTACSLLQAYLNSFGNVAVTVEDPPELPLEGRYPNKGGRCFQLEVQNGDFGAAMRATMRYMPRYILLGEVRDPAAASQALSAAINGHLVITTVHAGSVTEAIQRLLKIASAHDDLELARSILSEGLAGVLHQKLRRTKDPATGRIRVSIQPQFLFTGNEAKVRTKIRDGKIEMLKDDIERQRILMQQDKDPVETGPGGR